MNFMEIITLKAPAFADATGKNWCRQSEIRINRNEPII